MEQKIISTLQYINVYGILSISIFFGFFTGMLIWAFAQKRNYLNKMSSLPLDAGEKNPDENIQR
jgi:hypothetical protein